MKPDSSQSDVIAIYGRHALVMAGPGCGKTRIIARRIMEAHSLHSVAFADMLCLTFTNAAARQIERCFEADMGCVPDGLFVGNIHRLCARLLFAGRVVSDDTSILDDSERDSWLDTTLGIHSAAERSRVLDLAALIYQRDNGFPDSLRQRLSFAPDESRERAARAYIDFKRLYRLIDFDDMILMAYTALDDGTVSQHAYSFIQVDEVQDMTALHLAIIDRLTSTDGSTAVFFGDERQAVFEFAGQAGSALDRLKQRCSGLIYNLEFNHRSTPALVSLCNDYAVSVLGADRDLLPRPFAGPDAEDSGLRPMLVDVAGEHLCHAVAATVRRWREECPDGNTAMLVRSNSQAERLACDLTSCGLPCRAVTRREISCGAALRLVCAHLSVIIDPLRYAEWPALLQTAGCVDSRVEADSLVAGLRDCGATPADWLYADGVSALRRLTDLWIDRSLVVFAIDCQDTDAGVHRIAARRYNRGRAVGDFSMTLTAAGHSDGLKAFAAFVGDTPLCGYKIAAGIRRLTADFRNCGLEPPCVLSDRPVDIADISRLLSAETPAAVTSQIIDSLVSRSAAMLARQTAYFSRPFVAKALRKFRAAYARAWLGGLEALGSADGVTTAEVLDRAAGALVACGMLSLPDGWDDVRRAVAEVTGDRRQTLSSVTLWRHIRELRILRPYDIGSVGSGETLIMTVHHAKGLEFDNVAVVLPLSSPRAVYVAMTRGRRRLALFRPPGCPGFGLSSDSDAGFVHVTEDESRRLSLLGRARNLL